MHVRGGGVHTHVVQEMYLKWKKGLKRTYQARRYQATEETGVAKLVADKLDLSKVTGVKMKRDIIKGTVWREDIKSIRRYT